MSYTFRKLQLKKVPQVMGWYLVIDNAEDLLSFRANYDVSQSLIRKAITEDFDVKMGKKHYTTNMGIGVYQISKIKQQSFADSLCDLIKESYNAQFKLIEQGYSILFSPNGISYSVDKDNEIYNTMEEIIKDEPIFPECKDVHYSQFPMGTHWYASIGCTDVKDKDGNIKWNTITEAEKAAEWFLNREV